MRTRLMYRCNGSAESFQNVTVPVYRTRRLRQETRQRTFVAVHGLQVRRRLHALNLRPYWALSSDGSAALARATVIGGTFGVIVPSDDGVPGADNTVCASRISLWA
jgi:hypothetical protein